MIGWLLMIWILGVSQGHAIPTVTIDRAFEQQGNAMNVTIRVSVPAGDPVTSGQFRAFMWFRPGTFSTDEGVLDHIDTSRKYFNFNTPPGNTSATTFVIRLADLGPFASPVYGQHFIMQLNPDSGHEGAFTPVAQYATVLNRNPGTTVYNPNNRCACQYPAFFCTAWKPPTGCSGSPYTDITKVCQANTCEGESEVCSNNVGVVIRRECLPDCATICENYVQEHPIDAPTLACEFPAFFLKSRRTCMLPPFPTDDNDLAGKDMDADGIRDDAEFSIIGHTQSLPARIHYAEMAKGYQALLSSPGVPVVTQAAERIISSKEACLEGMTELGDVRGSDFLLPQVLNNPVRSRAYWSHLQSQHATLAEVPPPCQ